MTEIRITFFKGPANNVTPAATKRIGFDALAQRLSVPQKGPKDGSYFVRGVCQGPRSNDNMVSAWLAVVDADHGADGGPCPPFDVAVEALESMNYEYCIYTSFSYTLDVPRYRILFPLEQAITTPAGVQALYEALLDMLTAEGAHLLPTQESATFSQPWYPPRYQTQAQLDAFRFALGGFKTLMPGELLQTAKKTVKKQMMKPAVDVLSCVQAIETGADVHNSMNSIIAHLAAKGVSEKVIEHYVALVVKYNAPREKVNARLREIQRSVKGAISKFAPNFCGKGTPEDGYKKPKIKIYH